MNLTSLGDLNLYLGRPFMKQTVNKTDTHADRPTHGSRYVNFLYQILCVYRQAKDNVSELTAMIL